MAAVPAMRLESLVPLWKRAHPEAHLPTSEWVNSRFGGRDPASKESDGEQLKKIHSVDL